MPNSAIPPAKKNKAGYESLKAYSIKLIPAVQSGLTQYLR